jgi:two-component system CheB/CheR fusion protein
MTTEIVAAAVALVALTALAAVLWRQRRLLVDLERRTKDLADVSYALDQSAIVAITDTKGRIKFVNQKFCDVSQYTRDELIGQDHRILNSKYHSKEFIRDLWTTIASGRIWRGEIRNRRKDGTFYWVDTTIVPFLNDDGRPYQYMAIRYEITNRKHSEERLREQDALARLGQMAAVVAHEVKNPIAGIRGALQVIGGRMPDGSRDRPIIAEIIARLDSLNAIVQDLLVFARPRELRAEPVDLKSMLEELVTRFRRDPEMTGVELAIAAPTAVVRADAEQLQIVFQNILLNAAQAMNGQGRIDITVSQVGESWNVAVADHGPGMPPDVRDQAFTAFFTTKHRGTGLGLPIAKRIVDAHQGTIAIDTPESGGTTVSLTLPAIGR